ncbi:hypothetical protein PIB30_080883 [Stylosanthes scabra]|uniref:Uncharacterized protein n=1 Tax=Stylosanthes scabra TaxID=79078 RepID=A0ABU6ZQ85_9FABA|nr:hypothetical protein [Stylosanthes scabra]
MKETPEVQVEVPTEKPEIIAEIKNQEDVHHPPQSLKKHTRKNEERKLAEQETKFGSKTEEELHAYVMHEHH